MASLVVPLTMFFGVDTSHTVVPGWNRQHLAPSRKGHRDGIHPIVAIVGFALIFLRFVWPSSDRGLAQAPNNRGQQVTPSPTPPARGPTRARGSRPGHSGCAVCLPLLIAVAISRLAHRFVNGATALDVLFGALVVRAQVGPTMAGRAVWVRRPREWFFDVAPMV